MLGAAYGSAMPRRLVPHRPPRSWIASDDRAFGDPATGGSVEWAEPDGPADLVMLRCAKAQHHIAMTLRSLLRTKTYEAYEGSWRLVAEELVTMNYDALMDLLRGDRVMTWPQIQDLSDTFGPILLLSEQVATTVGLEVDSGGHALPAG